MDLPRVRYDGFPALPSSEHLVHQSNYVPYSHYEWFTRWEPLQVLAALKTAYLDAMVDLL